MYKVFIKNNELTFLKELKKSDNSTILLSEEVAMFYRNELMDRLLKSYEKLRISIIVEEIDKYFLTFFLIYLKVDAAGGLVKRKNSFLFIFRKGFWDLPKGKIEFDESSEKAAEREIEEECGIKDISLKRLLTITYHIYDDYGQVTLKRTFWYYFTFKGEKKLIPQTDEGIESAVWKKYDEINDEILENTYSSIKKVWKTYLKKQKRNKLN